MDINLKRKVSIIGIGSLSTLIILLMVEVLFAQILTDTLIGNIDDNLMLLVIILGLFLFTIIISVIVGYFITEDISQISVFKSSTMSLIYLIIFLFVVSNITLFINYRNIYSEVYGFEVLWIFPQVLVYFSIYILGMVFNLFVLVIVVYYIFFIFFLEKFYVKRV